MSHSLLPWEVDGPYIRDASGTSIPIESGWMEDSWTEGADRIIAESNNKFICTAVNNFEELVKSLSECVGSLREYHAMSKPPVKGRLGKELRVAEALLAKLKEKV